MTVESFEDVLADMTFTGDFSPEVLQVRPHPSQTVVGGHGSLINTFVGPKQIAPMERLLLRLGQRRLPILVFC